MDKRKYVPVSDRHLIAEQPGMTVVMIGFIVAFIIGYTVKSILSPARVSAQIEKAASHIHKDVRVHFESAQFSLSDGILPQMAVIISKIRMESEKACWGAPILEIDELRLPVSLVSAIRGQGAIRDIQANIVSLNVRQEVKNCDDDEQPVNPIASAEVKKTTPLVSLSPPQDSQKYQNDVRSIFVQKLMIKAQQFPQYEPELLNFAVNVKNYNPRVIELKAKTHLLKDEAVGDYLSHANLYVLYKESPERSVQTHVFGNWREGHYSVIANYSLDENLLAIETDLKHIPLSQILQMAQKYDLVSSQLNGRQVWISTKARAVSAVDKLKSTPMEIRDLRLEGDLGEMYVDKIDVQSIEPFAYAPIVVNIEKLDVEKLLTLLNRPKKTNVLGSLGQFTGRAEILSDKDMKMTGQHKGLEFVFSNKGQREVQIIETMVGNIALKNDTWSFDVRRVEPRGGQFIGDVQMKADRDFKEVQVKADVDEMSFDPAVQKLMTNGGSIGNMTIESDLRLKDGQMNFLKGLVRVDSMNIEGLSFGKTKAQVDWKDQEMILRTQMSSLSVTPTSPAGVVLKPVTFPSWWESGAIELSSLDGEFRIKSAQNMTWKKFQAQVGKNGKLITEGGWNSSGELHGHVLNREGKENKKWQISGTREGPLFSEESSSPNPMRK